MNATKRFFTYAILFILSLTLAACTLPGQLPPTPGGTGTIAGEASVDKLDVLIAESFPVQVQAHLSGNLPDDCTTIAGASVGQINNTFTITLPTTRPAGVACAEVLVAYEQVVTLDVLNLPAGSYQVVAGTQTANFELAVDNGLPTTPTPAPDKAAISGLVWHDLCAVAGGEGGEVAVPSAGCVELAAGGFAANGILEAGEPGIAGVEVLLRDIECTAPNLAATFTDQTGLYTFTGLDPGNYCLVIDPLANPNSGILIPGNWTLPNNNLANMIVSVTGTEDVLNVNFGWDYQFLPVPGDPVPGGTATPVGTATPTGTPEANAPGCTNSAKFVSETFEDDTIVAAGQTFTKVWTLENTGTCKWTKDYKLVFVSGEQMGGVSPTLLTAKVPPGEEGVISVALTAPGTAGTYRGDWMLEDEFGKRFGLGATGDKSFWVQVKVEGTVTNLGLGTPDWTDNFNTAGNWFLPDSAAVKFTVEDGKLKMRAKTAGGGDLWGLSNRPALDDFYLEAVFITGPTCVGLDRYGLLVRAPDPNAGYVINIACNGQFRIYEWDGQHYEELIGWKTSPAINTGPNATNRVGVWAEGDTLKLYINNVLIAELENDSYDSGQFGLLVGSTNTANLDIFVDEISYWILDD